MRKQNKFKVKEDLKGYVRNILAREEVPHRFRSDEGQLYCLTCLSGERFHKVVKRAFCEKKTEETGILHLTYAESQDANLCHGLMNLFKQTSFIVVGTDKTKN